MKVTAERWYREADDRELARLQRELQADPLSPQVLAAYWRAYERSTGDWPDYSFEQIMATPEGALPEIEFGISWRLEKSGDDYDDFGGVIDQGSIDPPGVLSYGTRPKKWSMTINRLFRFLADNYFDKISVNYQGEIAFHRHLWNDDDEYLPSDWAGFPDVLPMQDEYATSDWGSYTESGWIWNIKDKKKKLQLREWSAGLRGITQYPARWENER